MVESICESFQNTAKRLLDLDLGYLPMDRSASTLSTGERQRMQLSRAIRNCTTGVLYVLDEPSIGLHPLDVQVLLKVFQVLLDNGVIVIDHDVDVICNADYTIDMGHDGGDAGGRIVVSGTLDEIKKNKKSITGKYFLHTNHLYFN